jgi:hypothetical protein
MNEKMKILEMVENGQISADEAAGLLKALDTAKASKSPSILPSKKKTLRMFKVYVLSNDGDKVNVQIPLEFAKIALAKGTANNIVFNNSKLGKLDIDLDWDMIQDLIEQGATGNLVDIETNDGDVVKISIE